jgi:hypothetical protein
MKTSTLLRKAGATKEVRAMEKELKGQVAATLLAEYKYSEDGDVVDQSIAISMPAQIPSIRAMLMQVLSEVEEGLDESVKTILVGCYITPEGYQYHAVVNSTM